MFHLLLCLRLARCLRLMRRSCLRRCLHCSNSHISLLMTSFVVSPNLPRLLIALCVVSDTLIVFDIMDITSWVSLQFPGSTHYQFSLCRTSTEYDTHDGHLTSPVMSWVELFFHIRWKSLMSHLRCGLYLP